MTAIDELLTLLKEQGFEHYRHEVPAEKDCVAFYDGNRWHDCWDAVDGQWLDFLHVPFGRLTFDWLMDQLNDAYLHDIAQYDAENSKLRELLADTLMQPRDYCQKYGIEYESWDSANAHLDARMRELGVEL